MEASTVVGGGDRCLEVDITLYVLLVHLLISEEAQWRATREDE